MNVKKEEITAPANTVLISFNFRSDRRADTRGNCHRPAATAGLAT